MNGQELKKRRTGLGIVRQNFANLLGITENKLYRWEIGKTLMPPDVEQMVTDIEKRLEGRKNVRKQITV